MSYLKTDTARVEIAGDVYEDLPRHTVRYRGELYARTPRPGLYDRWFKLPSETFYGGYFGADSPKEHAANRLIAAGGNLDIALDMIHAEMEEHEDDEDCVYALGYEIRELLFFEEV